MYYYNVIIYKLLSNVLVNILFKKVTMLYYYKNIFKKKLKKKGRHMCVLM